MKPRVVEIQTDVNSIDARLPSDPADQSDVESAISTSEGNIRGGSDTLASLSSQVSQIQNNVDFSTTALKSYERPASGSKVIHIKAQVFDTSGNPEDPDSNTLNIALTGSVSGSLISTTAMTRLETGVYEYDYTIQSTDNLEDWEFLFSYSEGSVAQKRYWNSKLSDYESDINDIQTKVTAIHVKTDAGTPTPTIPAQITTHDTDIKSDIATHDTDIKALPNVKATPEFLTIPTGNTRIDQESGIDAVVTTIPVADVSSLQTEGVLLFGTEYIQYTGISANNELTGCTRGAYGSTASTHADGEQGYEVTIYPLRLMVSDNQGNMIAPDSAPTIEIVDWNGAVEIPSTAMTLISIGLYGYNYFVVSTDIPEPKVVRFSITVNSITTLRQSTLMMLDRPASQVDIIQIIGGGTGEFVVTQDGYFDSNNIFHAWTDVMAGYLRDATSGARLDDVLVTAYSVINGQTVYAKIPPGQTVCDENGNYEMRLDAGTYTFKFYKDQYRFPTDEVERVVTS
jgi:hypothetical protein